MIPIRLKLSGFLSYHDPVVLNLGECDLACISGSNGAGKSSLLDAITWVLFGQARKRDDSLVNLQSKTAEVDLIFKYETNTYRVIRSLTRGKTATLEFQIQAAGEEWRPLTEHTQRETQRRIEDILHLDYDTFINAAFFLQGKADQFAQQVPSRRKEILGNILGLEVWEVYKERAGARRKEIENELSGVDARLGEIETELADEPARALKLGELSDSLARLTNLRKAQEKNLENARQMRAVLEKQKLAAQQMNQTLERNRQSLAADQRRSEEKQKERSAHAALVARAGEIEKAYAGWQESRVDLERLDGVFKEFHEHDERRQPLLREIAAEQARLEQERQALQKQQTVVQAQAAILIDTQAKLVDTRQRLAELDANLKDRELLQTQAGDLREKQAELKTENNRLKKDMFELKARMDKLLSASGASCERCGQALSPEHIAATVAVLNSEGKVMGDQHRENESVLEKMAEQSQGIETQLTALTAAETERVTRSGLLSQLTEKAETLQTQEAEWKSTGAKRLVVVEKLLTSGKFLTEARKRLATLDGELAVLGYDAAAHDQVRRREMEGRPAEIEYRQLEGARAALKPLNDEIANLESQIAKALLEIEAQQGAHDVAAAELAAVETNCPDVNEVERELFALQEQENRQNQEVGAARQKVNVLDDLRRRKKTLEKEQEEFRQQIGHYRTLERAFGKDGVPALLIEQALPEIEIKANEILDRLTNGTMSVRFITQSAYKDKKRDDLKETLDIQISDGAGRRDYELYSGGEAFRANFAIRLALSEVLAKRKGARLQTLVIDEGFGSQDTQGRQRLVEAINSVRQDFACILVITHLDELKDAFPRRIEVEKTPGGSTAMIVGL